MVQEQDAGRAELLGKRERIEHVEVKLPPRKMLDVRVVEPRNESVVVEVKNSKEWYRAVVPIQVVRRIPNTDKAIVAEDDLRAGAYSEDWAALAESSAKEFPKRLADALREQGIFSFEDFRNGGRLTRAAIVTAHSHVIADLLAKEK